MPEIVGNTFRIDTCPHCGVNKPLFSMICDAIGNSSEARLRYRTFICSGCGGPMTTVEDIQFLDAFMVSYIPKTEEIDNDIPEKPRNFLLQALKTKHAPDGAVMLCASSVDTMLKEKGYKEGSLNSRINKAKEDHLITSDMALWAHDIRLDANDSRHADAKNPFKTTEDAERAIAFAKALAEYLFILPARVTRGRGNPTPLEHPPG